MFPINLLDFKRWPIKIKVRIPRSGGEEWHFDRARHRVDKDTMKEYYEIKGIKGPDKRHAKAKPACFKNMVKTNRGTFAEFYSPTHYEYYPCEFNDGDVKAMNEDQKNFYADVLGHANNRWVKTKWWERYGPMLMLVTVPIILAFALVLVQYGYSKYGDVYIKDSASKAGDVWERVTERYEDILMTWEDATGKVRDSPVKPVPPPPA